MPKLLHFEPAHQPNEPHPTRLWAAQAVANWRESQKPGSATVGDAQPTERTADAYTTQPLPSLETLLGDIEPMSNNETALHPTRAESLDDADGMVYVGRRSQSVNAKMKALGV